MSPVQWRIRARLTPRCRRLAAAGAGPARDAIAGRVQVRPVDLPSRLWSHPTISTYLAVALRHSVW
jgi:hypothetical protein